MKYISPVLCLLLLAVPAPAVASDQASLITLFTGRSRLFNTPSALERVAISDPKIADVRIISPKQILVQGIKPGMATVFVWTKSHGTLTYEVKVSLDANEVQNQVNTLTGAQGFRVAFNGTAFLLSGQAATSAQREAAEKIVASYGHPVVNLIPLPQRREQIAIEVMVLELSRTAGLNLGMTVGGAATTDISSGIRKYTFKPGQMDLGISSPTDIRSMSPLDALTVQIEALQRRGEAKLLARPTLVTVDGGTAKFLAGGEIPIPIQQGLGMTTIMWKEFGVRLEVQPSLTTDNRIALTVKPEVSSLDYASGIKQAAFNIPSLKTRRAETQVMLSPSETLLLGGLMNTEQSRGFEFLPGIGDLPVIGELFKSRRFQDNQTELAILVTPRLIAPQSEPTAPGQLEQLRKELSEVGQRQTGMTPVTSKMGTMPDTAPGLSAAGGL